MHPWLGSDWQRQPGCLITVPGGLTSSASARRSHGVSVLLAVLAVRRSVHRRALETSMVGPGSAASWMLPSSLFKEEPRLPLPRLEGLKSTPCPPLWAHTPVPTPASWFPALPPHQHYLGCWVWKGLILGCKPSFSHSCSSRSCQHWPTREWVFANVQNDLPLMTVPR